jgi:hypothetical protein
LCLKPHPTVPPPAHPFSLYDQLVKDPGNPETGIATAEAENFRFGRQRRTAQSSWGGDLSFYPGRAVELAKHVRRVRVLYLAVRTASVKLFGETFFSSHIQLEV